MKKIVSLVTTAAILCTLATGCANRTTSYGSGVNKGTTVGQNPVPSNRGTTTGTGARFTDGVYNANGDKTTTGMQSATVYITNGKMTDINLKSTDPQGRDMVFNVLPNNTTGGTTSGVGATGGGTHDGTVGRITGGNVGYPTGSSTGAVTGGATGAAVGGAAGGAVGGPVGAAVGGATGAAVGGATGSAAGGTTRNTGTTTGAVTGGAAGAAVGGATGGPVGAAVGGATGAAVGGAAGSTAGSTTGTTGTATGTSTTLAQARRDLTNTMLQKQTWDVNINTTVDSKIINNWKLAVKRALDNAQKVR